MGYADQLDALTADDRAHGIDIFEHIAEQFAEQQLRDREALAARADQFAAMHETIDRLRHYGMPIKITAVSLLGYTPTADVLVHATLETTDIKHHGYEIGVCGFDVWRASADSALLNHRTGKWNLNITFTQAEAAPLQVAA